MLRSLASLYNSVKMCTHLNLAAAFRFDFQMPNEQVGWFRALDPSLNQMIIFIYQVLFKFEAYLLNTHFHAFDIKLHQRVCNAPGLRAATDNPQLSSRC